MCPYRISSLALLLAAPFGCGEPFELVRIEVKQALEASAVNSIELWVVHEIGDDGTQIDCEVVISGRIAPWTFSLARRPLTLRASESSLVDDLPAGPPLVFIVRAMSGTDGLGEVLGVGCTAGIVIRKNQQRAVHVDLKR